MLKNYFKIALRNLSKNKVYSFINIFGLTVGLAACLLIALYIHDELSYDKFHENADRTYRVLREFDIPDLHATIPTTPPALVPALKNNLTAVEEAIRVLHTSPIVEHGTNKFVETSFISADPGFFNFFSFPIKDGQPRLNLPSTIVISEAMAVKYFGNENPIGKLLKVGHDEHEVTGVMADVPDNSHLKFDFVSSLKETSLNWGRNNYLTYLLLKKEHNKDEIAQQIAALIQANTDPENVRTGNDFIPHLQPITGIHLGQGVSADIESQGNIFYVYLFIGLGIFILLLACINYMNLASARSVERAREVGMRKTLGANRLQLAIQFISESVTMTFLALILAIMLCQLILPFINNLSGKSLVIESLFTGPQLLIVILFTLIIGIIAGFYPAFLLSSYKPSQAVKGVIKTSGSLRLRRGLVVFQFAISTFILAGTGIVYQQFNYMKSTGLGFEVDNTLVIEKANFLGDRINGFKEAIEAQLGINKVSSGFSIPGTFFINSMWKPSDPDIEAQNLNYSFIDFDYIETLDIEILAGRSFSPEFSTDSMAVVLNEAAIKEYGWTPQEAIGKQLGQGEQEYTIIGVAKNFHYESLHAEIYPVALFGPQITPQYIITRISSEDMPSTIATIQEMWHEFSDLSFEYSFLADNLASQYQAENRLAQLLGIFSLIAILLGCMGLFGLAAFMVSQRTKEIGVRKVLGATIPNIIGLLSLEYLKWILFGFLISVPIAWYSMNRWLANFAYQIEIGSGIFLMVGAVVLLIALLTVSWQSVKAAIMDPVESLKSE